MQGAKEAKLFLREFRKAVEFAQIVIDGEDVEVEIERLKNEHDKLTKDTEEARKKYNSLVKSVREAEQRLARAHEAVKVKRREGDEAKEAILQEARAADERIRGDAKAIADSIHMKAEQDRKAHEKWKDDARKEREALEKELGGLRDEIARIKKKFED